MVGTISPKDVDGLAGEEFGVYEYFSKAFKIMKTEDVMEIKLKDSEDYRLYILVPLKNGCGVMGRTDKFMAPATVRYHADGGFELVEAGPYAYVENRELKFV